MSVYHGIYIWAIAVQYPLCKMPIKLILCIWIVDSEKPENNYKLTAFDAAILLKAKVTNFSNIGLFN